MSKRKKAYYGHIFTLDFHFWSSIMFECNNTG